MFGIMTSCNLVIALFALILVTSHSQYKLHISIVVINTRQIVALNDNLNEALRGTPSTESKGFVSTKYGDINAFAFAKVISLSSGQVSAWHSQRFSNVGKQYSPSLVHSESDLHFGPQCPRAEASSRPHRESLSAVSRSVQTGCCNLSNVLQ